MIMAVVGVAVKAAMPCLATEGPTGKVTAMPCLAVCSSRTTGKVRVARPWLGSRGGAEGEALANPVLEMCTGNRQGWPSYPDWVCGATHAAHQLEAWVTRRASPSVPGAYIADGEPSR